jgi:hypothetical protein
VVTNAVQHDVWALEDQPVREAEDSAADELQPAVACDIARGTWEVGCAVGFDDDCSFDAEEVDDESPERVLAPELHVVERAIPEERPQRTFGRRCCSSERS